MNAFSNNGSEMEDCEVLSIDGPGSRDASIQVVLTPTPTSSSKLSSAPFPVQVLANLMGIQPDKARTIKRTRPRTTT